MRYKRASFLWAAGLMLVAGAAAAQGAGASAADKERARDLANKAYQRFEAGDYQGAVDAMTEAQKYARPPTFVRFLGQALEKLGRLVSAEGLYREVAEMKLPASAPAPWKKAQSDARKDLAAVGKRIPTLEIVVAGAGAGTGAEAGSGAGAGTLVVRIDGKVVATEQVGRAVKVDPGRHTVVVEAAGRAPVTREVVLKEGAAEKLRVELAPLPEPKGIPSVSPGPSVAPVSPGSPGSTPGSAGPAGAAATAPMPAPSSVAAGVGAPSTASSWLPVAGYGALGVGVAGLAMGAITGGIVLGEVETLRSSSGPCTADLKVCAGPAKEGVEEVRTLGKVSTAGFVIGGVGAAVGIVLLVLPASRKKAPSTPSVGIAVSGSGVVVSGGF